MLENLETSPSFNSTPTNFQLNPSTDLNPNGLTEISPKPLTGLASSSQTSELTPLSLTDIGTTVPALETDYGGQFQADALITSSGEFQVVGNKIYDPNNREFIAKGINVNGPGFGWPGNTPSYVDEITGDWGFNAIRLNVRSLQPSPYTYTENGTIDQIVQAYTNAGAVVMIEPHEKTGKYWEGTELTQVSNWFKDLATRYQDNPYVWFNTSNEPGGSTSVQDINKWLTMNESIIESIRSTGADNVVVVDDHFWGQGSGQWNGNSVPQSQSAVLSQGKNLVNKLGADGNNIVFSLHTYDQWEYGDTKFNSYFDQAQNQGLAVVLGEYGSTTDGQYVKATQSALNTAVPREIGRFAWAWQGGDAWDLTTAGGGQNTRFDASGKPTNLTWFGQQVWNDLQRQEDLQQMPSGTSTPGSTPTTLRLEAEKMQLTNYRIESNSAASGTQFIGLPQTGITSGSAASTFSGVSGKYDIVVGYFDESDGQGSLNINVNNQNYAVAMNQNLGSTSVSPQNLVRRTLATGVSLPTGASVKINGIQNGSEYARVDYLEFVPSSTSSTPTTLRLEAEKLQLTNYRIESNSAASGTQLIGLPQTGILTGKASGQFTGVSGTYDVIAGYFDESDGQASLNVKVGSNGYNVTMNQSLGSTSVSPQNLVRRTLATGLNLQSGTALEITGTMNGSEYARVDYLEFVPRTPVSTTSSTTALAADDLLEDATLS